jgi:hypothetical protein
MSTSLNRSRLIGPQNGRGNRPTGAMGGQGGIQIEVGNDLSIDDDERPLSKDIPHRVKSPARAEISGSSTEYEICTPYFDPSPTWSRTEAGS